MLHDLKAKLKPLPITPGHVAKLAAGILMRPISLQETLGAGLLGPQPPPRDAVWPFMLWSFPGSQKLKVHLP